ncbi:hypothetical protein AMJ80_04530 [bacterium SM23_31]|nr:MAG: hypothetical protein AMJ80_04530 [bacterium SM23_31]
MNIKSSKVTVIFIVVLILYTLSCSESLPLYEEPEIPFEYTFGVLNEPYIEYSPNSPYPLILYFGFRHLFDEYLSGEYYRRGYIDIWLADNPSVKKHFEFYDYKPTRTVVLKPGAFYYYNYAWFYNLDDGSELYEHLTGSLIAPNLGNNDVNIPTSFFVSADTINLKAKGEIQIFK